MHEKTQDFAKEIEKNRALIGLDIGEKSIGVAISDTTHIIASPDSVYTRRNISKDLGYLNEYIQKLNIGGIVIGLPLDLSGQEGENCEKVRAFATKLHKKTSLPVLLKDERMSTASATRALKESGMTRKKRELLDDKVAASYILQGVLDLLKS